MHLGRLGRDRNLAIVFQVELRQSVKFMERFSTSLFREYPSQIRAAIVDGQESGQFRRDINPTTAAKAFFGALDEMATNWILEPTALLARGSRRADCRLVPEWGSHAMTRRQPVRMAVVLGAGTMGAQIAAHLANGGVAVRVLDLTHEIAREGLKRAAALKPDPFFTKESLGLVATGSLDDLSSLASADWIIEAVVERIDIKRALLQRVDAARAPGTLVSSNTSGIPLGSLAEGRSDDFRRHWLGTHFFNPPRYLHLLELIPTAETDPDVLERVAWFADHRLGKGVVVAKDTPNFIANHIGLFGVMQVLRQLGTSDYTIEEIDAITGPALGRPKSATFRTMDIAGIDVLAHVASNLAERLDDPAIRKVFEVPPLVRQMIERGLVGEKSGQGFYKRVRSQSGGSEILTLDPATLTYRPRQSPRLPSLDAARSIDDVRQRIRTLFLGQDRVGEFLRVTLGPMLVYTADVTPQIAHSIDDVDRAMRWGFGWELGPFETWDAIGLKEVLEAVPARTSHRSLPG